MRYNFKKFDIVKHRKIYFTISTAIMVIGLIAMLVFCLNYGVDFKAGTALDVTLEKAASKQQILDVINKVEIKEPTELRIGSDNKERITIRFDEVLTDKKVFALRMKCKHCMVKKHRSRSMLLIRRLLVNWL